MDPEVYIMAFPAHSTFLPGKHYTDQVYSTAAMGEMAMGIPEEIWWATVEIK